MQQTKNVLKTHLRVVFEVVGHGDPDGALPLLTVVLQDDAGDGAALADAGAVADEKAGTVAVLEELGNNSI